MKLFFKLELMLNSSNIRWRVVPPGVLNKQSWITLLYPFFTAHNSRCISESQNFCVFLLYWLRRIMPVCDDYLHWFIVIISHKVIGSSSIPIYLSDCFINRKNVLVAISCGKKQLLLSPTTYLVKVSRLNNHICLAVLQACKRC